MVGASGQGPGSEGNRGPGWQPPFELLESKLHPPRSGRGIVPRTALLERLLTVPAARLVCVAAPSGYGKTTLLAQWAERRRGRRAWVTLDRHDNDPVVLLRYLAVALDRVDPIDSELRGFLESPGAAVPASLISRFVAGLSSLRRPVTVVLDNLELLVNQECLDAVAEVGLRLPTGSSVALASRARPSLPSALTNPAGQLVEVGAQDLAMDEGEVRAVLEGAGVRLSDAEVADLLERTEGWPVGVYLASSAVAGAGRHAARTATSGNGQVAAGEPPADLLGRLSPPTVAFLTRTAVLDELSGPLCDAVLQVRGSDRVLESLAGSNLLLVELEHRDRRYRYHQFLRELLLAELERREPELVDELHRRAAAWYEDEGRRELAVDHGQAAGDGDRVARLVAGLAFGAYAGGRVQTARGWFRWFEDQGLVERYPRIAMLGAQLETLLGNASTAERWAAVAERGLGRAPADATMDASMALLRTLLCRDGMAAMRADASAAWDGLDPDSPWRPTALLMEGVSYLLDGQADLADPILARAVEIAEEYGATPAASAALGERAVIAMERQRWDEAGRLSDRALTALRAGRLHDYAMAAFVHAVAARAVLHHGDGGGRAREHLRRATNLRPLLTSAMPHRSVQTLAEMARAYLALEDAAGARAVLRQAGEIIRQRPSLGVLPGQVGGLQTAADELGQGMLGASSLTAAELRLLPLLSTHLSLLEIGERLHLSRNTVKTHAVSIYRKLGVSSRSEAMQRARELGLLER